MLEFINREKNEMEVYSASDRLLSVINRACFIVSYSSVEDIRI